MGVRRVGASPELTDHFKGREAFVFLEDDPEVEGPLAALSAALSWTVRREIPWLLVLSCDMPAVRMQLLAGMVALAMGEEGRMASAVVPQTPGRARPRYQPLHALYRARRVLPFVEEAIGRGEFKLQSLVERLPEKVVLGPPRLESLDPMWRRGLFNVNTAEDLSALDEAT